jgi:hypothetical protein
VVEVFRVAIGGGHAGGTRRGRAGGIEDTCESWDVMSKGDVTIDGYGYVKEENTLQVCVGSFELLPSRG